MIDKLQTVLKRAQRGKYAVGAFNVSDLEQMQAVVLTAKSLRSPVIVNLSESALEYGGYKTMAELALDMARQVKIPVVVNLDHGRSLATVRRCLHNGFTGIMYDGSSLNYATNLKNTHRAVILARERGIGVEGEVGRVKYLEDGRGKKDMVYTDPGQAVEFVKQTGVCALAVAIGNAHGLPQPDEKLDFKLLAVIKNKTTVPLVLHGASGTPVGQIKQAIKLGIAKINIDTDLRLAFTKSLRATLKSHPREFNPRELLSPPRAADARTVRDKIIMFGSRNQA